MREQILTFGNAAQIIGIMSEASQASKPAAGNNKKPMVLLSNAGLLHRVGPNRQWVELAQILVDDGFSVFRFDLSGLGDSDLRHDSLSDADRPIHDIIEVMDYLEKNYGANQFIIIGLCSGANFAFSVGVIDKRVVGSIFIDGFAYHTRWWHVHDYLNHLKEIRYAQYRLRTLIKKVKIYLFAKSKEAIIDPQYIIPFPPQEQVENELGQLIDRGVDMFFIYSGGIKQYLNYANQFRDMFPKLKWKDKIQVQYFPETDHTFTELKYRSKLHESILQWLKRF